MVVSFLGNVFIDEGLLGDVHAFNAFWFVGSVWFWAVD